MIFFFLFQSFTAVKLIKWVNIWIFETAFYDRGLFMLFLSILLILNQWKMLIYWVSSINNKMAISLKIYFNFKSKH
jgi:hypothetical protein